MGIVSLPSGVVAVAVALTVPSLAANQEPQAPGIELLVERVQERLEEVTDLRGRFVQRRLSRLGSVTLEVSGRIFVQPPGKMRWEYDNDQLFVATGSGRESYLYFAEDNQVQVIQEELSDTSQTPILYLSGRGNLRRDFRVSQVQWGPPLDSGNIQLELVPRRRQTSFRRLILEVEPMRATIARLIVFENTNNTIDYQFHDVEVNVGLDDSIFEFEIPEGADVMYIGG